MSPKILLLVALCGASTALATPKIESVTVDPKQPQIAADKPADVEVTVSVIRSKFDKGGCDARVDFGDGEGRTIDFEVAAKRNVHHAYKKPGSYTVVAKGAGKAPCDGIGQMPVIVQGPPPPPKPAAKKAEPKKEEKKASAKKAPAKKKTDDKKAPAKKDAKKKDDSSK